jgi:peptidoglycan/LPS O-acetylase OafA/YrhL
MIAVKKAKKIYLKKLDSVRGFAALYVMVSHWVLYMSFVPHTVKKLFFSFGQEMVVVFFLLSGFGIYLSFSHHPEITFRDFFLKRFRRIYIPFLITILISIFVYYLNGNLESKFSWFELGGNLLMLQDNSELKPGTLVEPFLENLPLWTLSYEWWFYILFFPLAKLFFNWKNLKNRIYLVLTFSAFSYLFYLRLPNHFALLYSYFVIWWSGLEFALVYLRYRRFPLAKIKPVLISLFLMSILTAFPVLTDPEKIRLGYYPFLVFRHCFVALNLINLALIWSRFKWLYFDNILGLFARIAPISYCIYLFHYPLLIRWNLTPYISNFWLESAFKFAIIIGLSYLIEVKLQRSLDKWIK